MANYFVGETIWELKLWKWVWLCNCFRKEEHFERLKRRLVENVGLLKSGWNKSPHTFFIRISFYFKLKRPKSLFRTIWSDYVYNIFPAFLVIVSERCLHVTLKITVKRRLEVQTEQWRTKEQAQTGTQPGNVWDGERKEKALNVILHSWHGVEREEGQVARNGRERWEEGDKREGFVWRQTDFQCPRQTTTQKHLQNIGTTQVAHQSFWWLPIIPN